MVIFHAYLSSNSLNKGIVSHKDNSHMNSFVYIEIWTLGKSFSIKSQEYGFSPVCVLLWIFKPSFVELRIPWAASVAEVPYNGRWWPCQRIAATSPGWHPPAETQARRCPRLCRWRSDGKHSRRSALEEVCMGSPNATTGHLYYHCPCYVHMHTDRWYAMSNGGGRNWFEHWCGTLIA